MSLASVSRAATKAQLPMLRNLAERLSNIPFEGRGTSLSLPQLEEILNKKEVREFFQKKEK